MPKGEPPPIPVLAARVEKAAATITVSRDDPVDLSCVFDPLPDDRGERTVRMLDLFAAHPDQFPEIDYLVDRLVFRRGLFFIAGPPKQGKSLLRRHLAVSIALGEAFVGHKVTQGRVVMVADEDEAADELRVMGWMARALDRDPVELKGRIYLIPPCALKVDDRWDIEAVTALLQAVDPAILFLDPLVRYHDQEENSNTEMQAAIRPLAELGRKWSICVVHHSAHERPGGLRGAGDLTASYKALWKVSGNEGDTSSIRVTPILKAGPQTDPFRVGYRFDDDDERMEIWSEESDEKVPRLVERAEEVLRECGPFPSKNAWFQAIGPVRKADLIEAIDWLVREGIVVYENNTYSLAQDDEEAPADG